jgi:hypothetical protein
MLNYIDGTIAPEMREKKGVDGRGAETSPLTLT